jgi:hypothetical protein
VIDADYRADHSYPDVFGAQLAVAGDRVEVAYGVTGGVVFAERTSAGWVRRAEVRVGDASFSNAVRHFVIDAMGRRHIVYYAYEGSAAGSWPYGWRYVRVNADLSLSLDRSIAFESAVNTYYGVSLAVDAAGDAFLAYAEYVGDFRPPGSTSTAYVVRTYDDTWLPRTAISPPPLEAQAITFASDGTLHVGGHSGARAAYFSGIGGIFSVPAVQSGSGVSDFAPRDSRQVVASEAGIEIWIVSGSRFYRATVSGGMPSAFTDAWTVLPGSVSQTIGHRGLGEVRVMTRSSDAVTLHRGSPAARTSSESLRLPGLERLLDGTLGETAAGAPHVLVRQGVAGTSRARLIYLRRD